MQTFKRVLLACAYLQLGSFAVARLIHFVLTYHFVRWLYPAGLLVFPGFILFSLLTVPNLILFAVYVVKARLRKVPLGAHVLVVMCAVVVLDGIYRHFWTRWGLSFL